MPWDVFWTFVIQGAIFLVSLLVAGFVTSAVVVAIWKGIKSRNELD